MIDFVSGGLRGRRWSRLQSRRALDAGTFVDAADRKPRGSVASFDDGKGASRWTIDNTGPLERELGHPFVPVVIRGLGRSAGNSTGDCAVELKNELEDEAVDLGG